jgi:hypothetical protein
MRLLELFDQPYRFARTVNTTAKVYYVFESEYSVNGQKKKDLVQCNFNKDHDKVWALGFAIGDSDEATGNFDSLRIFSTIVEILKDFMATVKNDLQVLYFGADINQPSRIKLYDRLAKKASSVGLKLDDQTVDDGIKWYTFTRIQR